MQVVGCGASDEGWGMGDEGRRLQVAGCRLQVAGCRLYVLQITGCWLPTVPPRPRTPAAVLPTTPQQVNPAAQDNSCPGLKIKAIANKNALPEYTNSQETDEQNTVTKYVEADRDGAFQAHLQLTDAYTGRVAWPKQEKPGVQWLSQLR
jgi:hypothetical protein